MTILNNKKNTRMMIGTIISDKMKKTIVVAVERIIKHPRYSKIIKRRTKCYVHDENQIGKIGNIVKILGSRPISKKKSWVLSKIIS